MLLLHYHLVEKFIPVFKASVIVREEVLINAVVLKA